MSGIVSHSTDLMRGWSENINDKSNNYDELINKLYNLIDFFVGSEDFRGGITKDFEDSVISHREEFKRYSSTFRECTEYISKAATDIESDEAELKASFNNANPFGE